MTTCPHCTAKNDTTATDCRACGEALPPAVPTATAELPAWLRQMNPESAPAADVVLETAPAPPQTAAATAVADPDDRPLNIAPAPEQTDAATASTTARQPIPQAAAPAPKPAPAQVETASLVSEDDLPAWLRAFSDNDSLKNGANDRESEGLAWMAGVAGAGNADADDLAHSWQTPSQPAAKGRSGAGSLFAKVSESPPAQTAPQVAHHAPASKPTPASDTVLAHAATPTAKATAPATGGGARVPVAESQGGGSKAVIVAIIGLIMLLVALGLAAKLLGMF